MASGVWVACVGMTVSLVWKHLPGTRSRRPRENRHQMPTDRPGESTGRPEMASLGLERARVMAQVIVHEGRDEEVAVVVALVDAQLERLSRAGACRLEELGLELALEELVAGPLVDEELARKRALREQRDRVVFGPAVPSFAEVARERLLPPGHLARRHNRRERRNRSVLAREPKRDRERSVAAHRVTEDAPGAGSDGKARLHEVAQLARDPGPHPVRARPRRFGR